MRRATTRLDQPEQQAREQRAEQVADAAHDDDDQRLHREDDAHRGVEGEEHADQHAAGRAQRAAEREGEGATRRDIDGDKAGGGRIDGDGADARCRSACGSAQDRGRAPISAAKPAPISRLSASVRAEDVTGTER